jgi:hypothetical protein
VQQQGAALVSVDPQPRVSDPEVVIQKVVTDSVDRHLSFNVRAYGTPWTGEYADSEFIAGAEIGAIVVLALREAGWDIAPAYAPQHASGDSAQAAAPASKKRREAER